MSEVVFTKSQEEYEDDFEKDLDWLISEEDRSEEQVSRAAYRPLDRLIPSPLSTFTLVSFKITLLLCFIT